MGSPDPGQPGHKLRLRDVVRGPYGEARHHLLDEHDHGGPVDRARDVRLRAGLVGPGLQDGIQPACRDHRPVRRLAEDQELDRAVYRRAFSAECREGPRGLRDGARDEQEGVC